VFGGGKETGRGSCARYANSGMIVGIGVGDDACACVCSIRFCGSAPSAKSD
jgi:hypothetical protein